MPRVISCKANTFLAFGNAAVNNDLDGVHFASFIDADSAMVACGDAQREKKEKFEASFEAAQAELN